MKNTLNTLVSIGLTLIHCVANAQTTPIDNIAAGPHIFFEARNRHAVLTNNGLDVTFDLYMSASQAYLNYVKSPGDGGNGPQFGLESVDVAFDIDFGAPMEAPFVLPNGNSITVKNAQLSAAQAQTNVKGSSPAGYDTRFKYSLFREANSEPLSSVPTLVASVSLFWAPELVGAGFSPDDARIQLRCASTGFGTGLSGSKWADFTGNAKNSVGSSEATKPLPVTLVSFNGNQEGNTIFLTWKTTDETNSNRFEVERSSNGKNWRTIQTVKAIGESKVAHHYDAIDTDPLSGENLYRLRMIDHDGSTAFSKIVSVQFEGEKDFIFPNPVADKLYLKHRSPGKISAVEISNAAGKAVLKTSNISDEGIDVKMLEPGLYSIKVLKGAAVKNYKVVVIK
ncbi:T9SS type A sorting domain-containing protein [Dyadobacter crusticola]|uniref:T9SS type A sorting domain-containing protein n=1 Tax=Dyadobacter crusticola TaxID=292407 RepID=UPI000691FEB7|nr:T9SS type A sorting domain-containing protein [Dyadobacter crusticola]